MPSKRKDPPTDAGSTRRAVVAARVVVADGPDKFQQNDASQQLSPTNGAPGWSSLLSGLPGEPDEEDHEGWVERLFGNEQQRMHGCISPPNGMSCGFSGSSPSIGGSQRGPARGGRARGKARAPHPVSKGPPPLRTGNLGGAPSLEAPNQAADSPVDRCDDISGNDGLAVHGLSASWGAAEAACQSCTATAAAAAAVANARAATAAATGASMAESEASGGGALLWQPPDAQRAEGAAGAQLQSTMSGPSETPQQQMMIGMAGGQAMQQQQQQQMLLQQQEPQLRASNMPHYLK
mmetsp:Transcript_34005/g.89440  ORF Transcript_34005/g.89440 Transcript_34005/m.89440 type:complete len:293 (-) Transcript_34005:687-1565(-)